MDYSSWGVSELIAELVRRDNESVEEVLCAKCGYEDLPNNMTTANELKGKGNNV